MGDEGQPATGLCLHAHGAWGSVLLFMLPAHGQLLRALTLCFVHLPVHNFYGASITVADF